MGTIINIETSTHVCSVALCKDNKVISIKENKDGLNHAKLVTSFIEDILKENSLSLKDIDAIAVSKGPGSYTGLRIGVSTAKGLCYGANLKLIAIDTLQAMTADAISKTEVNDDTLFCPMIDARRMEVFCAFYNKDNRQTENIKAVIVDNDSFKDVLDKHKVVFFGTGADKCKETITHKNAFFIDNLLPSASNMTELSNSAYNSGKFEDVAYFEPFYLKDFIATTPKKKII